MSKSCQLGDGVVFQGLADSLGSSAQAYEIEPAYVLPKCWISRKLNSRNAPDASEFAGFYLSHSTQAWQLLLALGKTASEV